ncbi:putative regulator of chromosome condensation rcc1 protein [Neofusicoccum parvum UCRNP2]|uniref:Putative regulator of chromosome condensation rcc1 protein n=1 Tax=Botryosphaeria parva (strain UCR-NP2) TaxID=1287680 RepID=R1E990_BOTPV|nr:putative regulator of chromosome condensation rcc1 protein [Neofusicoccum parvum UCRNP2]
MNEPGWCIIFAEREISEKAPNYGEQHSHIFREQSVSSASGSVRKVVAGWNTSSAYINGAGIILWATANRKHYGSDLGKDTLVIQHTVPIPKTNYIRPARSARDHDDATQELGQTVGEVLNYIVLEHFVVFVTDLGKFFAAKMSWHDRDTTGHVDDIVELKDLQANPETMSKRDSRVDIQGSFRTPDPENPTAASLKWVPALQNSGVISIALGDYHYHALHIDGTISSEWIEQQGSDWDKREEIAEADSDGLGTHFALSVAAAGWHSGALVLVNDELSKKLEESCIIRDSLASQPTSVDPSTFNEPWNHGAAVEEGVWYKWAQDRFPRLKLSNGQDMPGGDDVPFVEWKAERPQFVLDRSF